MDTAAAATITLEPVRSSEPLPTLEPVHTSEPLPTLEPVRTAAARPARRRLAVAAMAATGCTAALLAGTAGAALAYQGWGGTLLPGQQQCVQQYASYQVRGEGTATAAGAKFRVYRDGTLIYATPTGTASAFAAEFRSSNGNFPGPGYYQVCARNPNAGNTLVNIRILVDGDF